MALGFEVLLPHSGHFEVVVAARLYLHFLQCGWLEMRFPIRPFVMRSKAIAVRIMMRVKIVAGCISECLCECEMLRE